MIVLVLTLLMLVLLPFAFANVLAVALLKLGLPPHIALAGIVAMFVGGAINIPIKRIPREELVSAHPLAVFGLHGLLPRMFMRRETVIAVNVGGCLIPGGLAVYEIVRLSRNGMYVFLPLAVAILVNVAICYFTARPEPQVGIRMRPIFPAVTAAVAASLLLPDHAPAVALVAGVLGPLIGADLLHLRDFVTPATGFASIGGAGSFDGIVFSAILAVYLA
jgi:uncharacterized membrane protein